MKLEGRKRSKKLFFLKFRTVAYYTTIFGTRKVSKNFRMYFLHKLFIFLKLQYAKGDTIHQSIRNFIQNNFLLSFPSTF